MTLAVDAMGGTTPPVPPLKEPSRPPSTSASTSSWWGAGSEIEPLLLAASYRGSRIGIVEAEEVVGFDEPSTAALRKKPRASVRVAAELVRDGARRRVLHRGAHRAPPW